MHRDLMERSSEIKEEQNNAPWHSLFKLSLTRGTGSWLNVVLRVKH